MDKNGSARRAIEIALAAITGALASLMAHLVLFATTLATKDEVRRTIAVESPYAKDAAMISNRLGQIDAMTENITKLREGQSAVRAQLDEILRIYRDPPVHRGNPQSQKP